jgi:hypothetical protein
MASHLNRYMRRRAKTIKPESGASVQLGKPETSKSDDPGAEQGRCGRVFKSMGKRIDKCFRRDGVLCVTAVYRPSGELRAIA